MMRREKQMKIRILVGVIGIASLLAVGLQSVALAQDKATPREVIDKVTAAVGVLAKSAGSDLADFNKPDGQWVWKDSYIVVQNCETGITAAHPNQNLVGKNMMGLKDIKGNAFFPQFCEVSKKPGGGWVEYWWPKPNEKEPTRKLGYALEIPNSPFIALAGIYDDKISLEELEKLIKK